LELFGVRDIGDYALNQIPGRNSYRIDRLAQMVSPVALHFRAPADYPPRSTNPLTTRKNIEQGLLFSMCDGEFIEMYHPKDIIISRKVTLKAVGRSPESSRIVLDTIKNDGLDAVQMDATAAANKMHGDRAPDVSNYVASPFQRIFRLGRRSANVSRGDLGATDGSATGSILDTESPISENPPALNQTHSQPGTFRRSPFTAIRNSLFGSSRNSADLSRSSSTAGSTAQSTASAPADALLRANTIAVDAHAQPGKQKKNAAAFRHTMSTHTTVQKESPLRHSMEDLSVSDPVAAASASPQSEHNDSDSDSDSDDDTHTSVATAEASSTVGNDETSSPRDSVHKHCLLTLGKDLVNTVEDSEIKPPTSPTAAIEPAPVQSA
ncbi:hypothetical protein LPJ73_008331, partial [Coemansia sp. RSA 2703]